MNQPASENYSPETGLWGQYEPDPWPSFEPTGSSETCCFTDVTTCPDCGCGMTKLGVCLCCPACGYGSCG